MTLSCYIFTTAQVRLSAVCVCVSKKKKKRETGRPVSKRLDTAYTILYYEKVNMVTSVLNLQAADPYHAVVGSDNALNTINLKKLKEDCINYLRSKLFFLPSTNVVGGEKGLLLNNTSFPTLANELERIVHPTRYFWINCRDLGTLHRRFLFFCV